MDVTKFVIDGNDVFIKDAQARDSITALSDDVTTAQNTADRAEGKADDAQTTADNAQSAASDALTELAEKQDNLNHPSFTGNIDDLANDNSANGYRFVNASTASGTQPKSTGYYMLLVFGGLQIAVDANATTVYFYARTYVNSAWSYWRKVQLTT